LTLSFVPEALREIAEEPWEPVAPLQVGALAGAVGLLALVRWRSPDGWVPILDSANLAFHEAGHPIFGLFGATLGLYGGTLLQLTIPAAVAFEGWRRRQAPAAALGAVWIGQNLLNVARYMADARAQVLPLVGGGEHDWFHILSRWGLLAWDTRLASLLGLIAWLTILAAPAWLEWRRRSAEPHG